MNNKICRFKSINSNNHRYNNFIHSITNNFRRDLNSLNKPSIKFMRTSKFKMSPSLINLSKSAPKLSLINHSSRENNPISLLEQSFILLVWSSSNRFTTEKSHPLSIVRKKLSSKSTSKLNLPELSKIRKSPKSRSSISSTNSPNFSMTNKNSNLKPKPSTIFPNFTNTG